VYLVLPSSEGNIDVNALWSDQLVPVWLTVTFAITLVNVQSPRNITKILIFITKALQHTMPY